MNSEIIALWLVTLLPIVISPGPANILYAASGSAFGVRGTVPFWLATNLTSIFQTLAVGFGLDFLLTTYPQSIHVIKQVGILFLLYLAVKFFKMSNNLDQAFKPLTFKDGVIVEILNVPCCGRVWANFFVNLCPCIIDADHQYVVDCWRSVSSFTCG
ncbi:MAG: LysE family transporter [Deltaproteobacteria bacterium]|nr:LysE family transporter [Deltaproteobacteria bacterium]